MNRLIVTLLTIIITQAMTAQILNQFYADIVAQTSQKNVRLVLTTFGNFELKTLGSSGLRNTKNGITSRYQTLGYADIELQPFTYDSGTTTNIIVTKEGRLFPNTFLIIDAHYDTINGPGTNDYDTGTILLLELARLLKDVQTAYSIKFIHFSGEEDGFIRNKFYVNNTVIPEQLDIKLVFNIDEFGGVYGVRNDTVVCERDASNTTSTNIASNKATHTLTNLIALYSNLKTEISNVFASDYIPFANNGEIITGLYESNVSPVNHTAKDNLTLIDNPHAFEVIKGSLGAVLEFSMAFDTVSATEQEHFEEMLSTSFNPATNELNITFKTPPEHVVTIRLIDQLGKQVYQSNSKNKNHVITLNNESKYVAVFHLDNSYFIKHITKD